ncbi:hypothetical protein CLF_109243 [Clonorchis sinensis]|uniref:Peptidase A2 domain-containing protein n=1 Tax=Clonorchis sinensis TaxID=79923 RepID=G7YJ37_CLOSI|nr:hypothetical protein CLF_109243 [Clonorchis sinensis]
MTITAEALKEIPLQQQKQFEVAQLRLVETLTQQIQIQPPNSASDTNSVDSIANSITEFHYDPDAGLTFDSWFRRYEDVFQVELKHKDDAWRVRLLLRKLGTTEHTRYSNFILPKNTRNLTFEKTVQQLSMIFGERSSLFNIRYQCMKLAKKESEDYITYAGRVNLECEQFKPSTMTEVQFKCLIFICGLQSHSDSDIRTRLLKKIEQTPEITLQSITHECQRLLNLKHDTAMLERPLSNPAFNIAKTTSRQPTVVTNSNGAKPPSACWQCGEWHFVRLCPYKKHKCSGCNRRGHKESQCRTRKASQRRSQTRRSRNKRSQSEPRFNAILATFDNQIDAHRKYVTIRANGSTIRLQLDTASDITIVSRRTWRKIGSPELRPTMNTARNASGGKLQLLGEFDCEMEIAGHRDCGIVYLAACELNLLGIDWIDRLHLSTLPIKILCSSTPTRGKPTFRPGNRVFVRDYRPGH